MQIFAAAKESAPPRLGEQEDIDFLHWPDQPEGWEDFHWCAWLKRAPNVKGYGSTAQRAVAALWRIHFPMGR